MASNQLVQQVSCGNRFDFSHRSSICKIGKACGRVDGAEAVSFKIVDMVRTPHTMVIAAVSLVVGVRIIVVYDLLTDHQR